ncbi:hypothetical protein Agub_g8583 [Astrephomene gubernaculifera]|uniref:Uncharacterized protein n=1 Tax=Astrephomene gubernaculifera TaxID=47775 RepID=A0AAD3DRW6_9CHLO|nr:hypothetical protein Agub_g8583 [Astrephomene gubernaculifera]
MAAKIVPGAFALLIVASALLATTADAHAGHFHLCPDTPSGKNYVRIEVGNCTTFTTVNTTANLTMSGKVTMWVYAYKNCSDSLSSALEFNTVLYQNGMPLASTNTTGYAYTGTCASSTKSVYYNNASMVPVNDATNMIFWKSAVSDANGTICGNAANSFIVRAEDGMGMLEASPLQSFVLSTDATGPAVCCDLSLYPKPDLSVLTSRTQPCNVPPPPSPPVPPSPKSSPPPPSSSAGSAVRTSFWAAVGAAMLFVMNL